jgi:cytosolic 5'-nucleotidase 3
MREIIVINSKSFEKKKKKFILDGTKNLHVLSDFDLTLTKAFVEGEKTQTIMAQLRTGEYISLEYSKKAHELFDKYHPIEIDPNVTYEEKKKKMEEWWKTHFDLLVKMGLNKQTIEKMVKDKPLKFRNGVFDFLDSLDKNKVPLIIISSTGLGNALPMYFEKEAKLYKNIYFVTNFFEFNKSGKVIGLFGPVIHVMNKDETVLSEFPFYEKIRKRKNIILLGDSVGDLGMLQGADYKEVIKIGFLNENIEENLEEYKKNFDVVITGDWDFTFVNELIEEIIKK